MSRLDTWKKRFRITGEQKPKVQVQTTSRLETMTVTQEWRFKQLQRFRFEERKFRSGPSARAWYTLADSSERLATTIERLLHAAAAGRLACYVAAEGLRGCWGETAAASDFTRANVSHLRLLPEACRDIAAYGSVNVTVLRHPTARGKGAQFVLQEPLWIDAGRILLKHPLPAIGQH